MLIIRIINFIKYVRHQIYALFSDRIPCCKLTVSKYEKFRIYVGQKKLKEDFQM